MSETITPEVFDEAPVYTADRKKPDASFEGDGAVKQAAEHLTSLREAKAPPLKFVVGEDAPESWKIEDAAAFTKHSREVKTATRLVEQGKDEAEAVNAVIEAREEKASQPKISGNDDVSIAEAAKRISEWRLTQLKGETFVDGVKPTDLRAEEKADPNAEAETKPAEEGAEAEVKNDKPREGAKEDKSQTVEKQAERAEQEIEKRVQERSKEITKSARAAYADSMIGAMALAASEFQDIRTEQDLIRLHQVNPQRFEQWKTFAVKAAYASQAIHAATAQQQAEEKFEREQQWRTHAAEQDHLFIESLPAEMKTPAKLEELRNDTIDLLTTEGISRDELLELYNGNSKIDIRDARVQKIIYLATRAVSAQRAAKNAQRGPLPPVQRPGVRGDRSAAPSQNISDLKKQMATLTGRKAIQAGKQLAQLLRQG